MAHPLKLSDPSVLPFREVVSEQSAIVLQDALRFYERFSAGNADDHALAKEVAEVHRRIGDIRQRLGAIRDSQRANDEALKHYRRLLLSHPGDQELVQSTASTHNRYGRSFWLSGQFPEPRQAHHQARELLGDGPLLMPELTVVLEPDAAEARAIGREFVQLYLRMPNYTNNLRRFGYTDDDLAGAGSDRLIDAVVAWGVPDAIAARVGEHLDAGADHVAIQSYGPKPTVEVWRALAPMLVG